MFNRYKIFLAYFLAIPFALLLGFLATSPDELTFMLLAMLLFCLALPLFIAWHHVLLIFFWNSAFMAGFLPGQPQFWLFFACLSFGISVLNSIMGRRVFLPVPEMTRPILFLTIVVLATAWYRGGIGIRSLGGAAYGGKYYVFVLGAIVGYFALTGGQISLAKSRKMAALYFLSGTSYVLSNLAYALGTSYFFLFYLVPSGFAQDQAASDYGLNPTDRIQGLAPACTAALCFMLAHYGIRGLFDLVKPWRLVSLIIIMGASLFAGFRSIIILLFLILAFQFYFEGLLRTRLLPVFVGIVIIVTGSIFLYSSRMPLAVQRAVSFLPVTVDSEVRADALGSTDWRFQMWAVVWKEVPKYLMIGKGYVIDPTELYAVTEASRRRNQHRRI